MVHAPPNVGEQHSEEERHRAAPAIQIRVRRNAGSVFMIDVSDEVVDAQVNGSLKFRATVGLLSGKSIEQVEVILDRSPHIRALQEIHRNNTEHQSAQNGGCAYQQLDQIVHGVFSFPRITGIAGSIPGVRRGRSHSEQPYATLSFVTE
ncbi:MAG: hypothetical protein K0U84_14195 [Actinomycetia bacterium]|nr:hypothetical protein [Actinomycetes bacterium]